MPATTETQQAAAQLRQIARNNSRRQAEFLSSLSEPLNELRKIAKLPPRDLVDEIAPVRTNGSGIRPAAAVEPAER